MNEWAIFPAASYRILYISRKIHTQLRSPGMYPGCPLTTIHHKYLV